MSNTEWERLFGQDYVIALTNEERTYLALNPLSSDWDTLCFYSKTGLRRTRVTVFFSGNTIVKVIQETRCVPDQSAVNHATYTEYDTELETNNRQQLLPLTSRGKPKALTASAIDGVTPFGCCFSVSMETGKDTRLYLSNPRANQHFPVGEWEAIAAVRSDADFHRFMDEYIATCRTDYFDQIQAFRTSQKVTVTYRPGDIFRMELDRTRYCYGIITGTVKQLKVMPELPEKHSLRQLMMVPILVRPYQLITEDPNLTAEQLRHIPLGRMQIVGDNDIIWGTHTIVDHKELEPEDLEFHFVCTKVLSPNPHSTLFTQDMLMKDGLIPKQEYTLYIEWGFAQTSLGYEQLSEKLRALMEHYSSPHGGVAMSIDPRSAVPDARHRQYYNYRTNLLNPENREILQEIFSCLGLAPDTTFDQFAEAFGGLTRQEILARC